MAVTYYVSTSGSNSNPGTISSPFATLQKAHDIAVAGDTIYMRGGTYTLTSRTVLSRNGSSGNPIRVFNYPAEIPIIDGISITNENHPSISGTNISWWHFKGLEIKNGPAAGIWLLGASNNNIIEQCNVHHNTRLISGGGGAGILIQGTGANNLILNNDSHHNGNPPVSQVSAGDGIAVDGVLSTGNVVRGNRLWRNNDDGIDLWDSSNVLVENNWAWQNGLNDSLVPSGGDGNGYKLGGGGSGDGAHTVRNNLAWRNVNNGIDDNAADLPMNVFNNTAYENGAANFGYFQAVANVLKNNISFGGGNNINASVQQSFNSWNLPVTVNSADFASLDFSAMATTPRNADGSLPTMNFLRLASGSDLIDKGTNVGIANSGSAPDLGAYEYGGSVTPPPPPSTLTATPASVTPGGTVTATWSGVPSPTVMDWIDVFTPSTPDGTHTSAWMYTSSCSQTAGATAKSSGSCSFTMPTTPAIYEIRLYANDNYTRLAKSGTVTVAVSSDTTPPSVPTGLTAAASASQVSLSWNASSDNVGVTGYRVYRNGTQIAAPASNSYIDGNLVPGTYSYSIAAVDAAGNVSAQSGSVSATVFRPPGGLRLSLASPVSFNATAEGKT